MNCHEARRWLSPYLDSELDADTTFAISEHLRACDACRLRFEGEIQADKLIATGLSTGELPDAMWRQMVQPLRKSRRVGWRLFTPLAMAAVIALVAWAGWRSNSDSPQPHWAVKEFLAETNGGKAFASVDTVSAPTGMRMPLKPFTNLVMNLSGEVAMRHTVQFVRLETVHDSDGSEVVEMRLNCCGEPVIVRAVKRDQPGRWREFIGADQTRLASLPTAGKVAVAEREVGEYTVVAVSRHPVPHLLAAMTVQ